MNNQLVNNVALQHSMQNENVLINRKELQEFHELMSKWIRELHSDIGLDGYLSVNSKSICSEKAKQLVEYTLSKSSELSSIRFHRKFVRTSSKKILIRAVFFVLETMFPIIVSLWLMYAVYAYSKVNSVEKEHFPTEYIYPDNYENLTYIEQIKYYVYPTFGIATQKTGSFLGTLLGGIFNIADTTIKEGIGVSISNTVLSIYYGLLSLIVGFFTFKALAPCSGLFQSCRITKEKEESLKIIEDEFIYEFNKMIERAIYSIIQPNIVKTFEKLLYMSSKSAPLEARRYIMSLIHTFSHDYSVLYITLMSSYEQHVRKMELQDIMSVSKPSANFTNLLFRLIRESSVELAQQLQVLNQTLIEIPRTMRESMMQPVMDIQPIVSDIVRRNISR